MVWRGPTSGDGPHLWDLRYVGPAVSPEESARALVRALSARVLGRRFVVDVLDPELAEAPPFGESPLVIDGAFGQARQGALLTQLAPSFEALLTEVVADVGWFSLGAYRVLIDQHTLIDRMRDGTQMDVYTTLDLVRASA